MVTRPIRVIFSRNQMTSITEIERYVHGEAQSKKAAL